jgi:CRISPR-associated protein Csm5
MNAYAGPMRAITRVTLRLVPLTPIHIGDGTEWRPDEYFIDKQKLCCFDQQAAMRSMRAVQRIQFATALNGGDLVRAAEVLRQAGRDLQQAGRAHPLNSIQLSQASERELRQAMTNPLRGGAVKPFIRSGGAPFIPGSSIKGAFRTALASAALPRGQRQASEWKHASAMAAAFGLDPHRTETDPLRFLSVSDARLPDDATVIDKAEMIKIADKGHSKGIQIHYERTKALAIENEAPEICVSLALDARAARPEGGIGRAEACFDLDRLLSRLREFHKRLFDEEMKRFFEGPTKKLLTDRLLEHTGPNKEPPLSSQGYAPGFVLLRLGRFGHFESKSLEGVRRGHFPQAKDRNQRTRAPNEWGLTRTITREAKNTPPIPFGWVIGWVVNKEERPC